MSQISSGLPKAPNELERTDARVVVRVDEGGKREKRRRAGVSPPSTLRSPADRAAVMPDHIAAPYARRRPSEQRMSSAWSGFVIMCRSIGAGPAAYAPPCGSRNARLKTSATRASRQLVGSTMVATASAMPLVV